MKNKIILLILAILIMLGIIFIPRLFESKEEVQTFQTTPTITEKPQETSETPSVITEDPVDEEAPREYAKENDEGFTISKEDPLKEGEFIELRTIYSGEGEKEIEDKEFYFGNNDYSSVLKKAYEYGKGSSKKFVLVSITDSEYNPIGVYCDFVED